MPGLDDSAEKLLNRLRDDHQSGATELALTTLRDLAAWVQANGSGAGGLTALLGELRKARPSMIVIGNAMARIESALASGEPPLAAVDRVNRELANAGAAIAHFARPQIPANAVIMTHSASSVVLGLFRTLARERQRFAVICTQSSPGMEGHRLARALDELGVPVTLITDAQMALFVAKADLVVSGCDSWLADGHFVNKSGTHLLALAARAHHKPFWVLGDSFRHSAQAAGEVCLEEMPAGELHAPDGDWITPRNIYFETIPQTLVTGRINEQGVVLCAGSPRR